MALFCYNPRITLLTRNCRESVSLYAIRVSGQTVCYACAACCSVDISQTVTSLSSTST